MDAGRDAHRCRVDLDLAGVTRGEAGTHVVEYMGLWKIRLQRLAARGIAFDNGRQTDRFGAYAQFPDDAKMVTAEDAGSDDGEPDGLWRGGRHLNYRAPLLPWTTSRQRV